VYGGGVEFALLQLEIEMVLAKLLQDLLYTEAMFGQVLGIYKDIVDVDDDKSLEELPEHLIHIALEDGA